MTRAEENIEAFKTWWKENGLKVVAGIVLLVGGYISWDLYEGKIKSEAEAASEIWQSITDSLSAVSYTHQTLPTSDLL